MWYDFHQKGDFVDFDDNAVFPALLESKGWKIVRDLNTAPQRRTSFPPVILFPSDSVAWLESEFRQPARVH